MYLYIGMSAFIGVAIIGFFAIKGLDKELNQEWLEPTEEN